MTYRCVWTAFTASALAFAVPACGGGPGETELLTRPADAPGAGPSVIQRCFTEGVAVAQCLDPDRGEPAD